MTRILLPARIARSAGAGESGASMPAPEVQARQHARVREAHETELIEDYVELIDDLQRAQGEARAADLARRLGVSHATVHNMLRRLVDQGLVTKEPYRSIFLTETGQSMAETSRRRHDIVLSFLRAAGVSEATAQADAEGIEHHVSDETLRVLDQLAGHLLANRD